MSRYGDAVEADLAFLGLDVGALWRRRQWRKLLNLIDHLPRTSYYVEAQVNDDELAERLVDQPAPKSVSSGPRMTEWSPEVEALAATIDRLSALLAAVIASTGNKPPKIPPYQRPRTAIDRVRERRRERAHRELVARVMR